MEGYVGFANLPNQVFRKSVKKGFEFTVMVVGKVKFIARTEANLQKQNNLLFHASLFWNVCIDCVMLNKSFKVFVFV